MPPPPADDASAEPPRGPARRRGGGRLPLAALLVAAGVLVAYAASLRADAGLVQSGLAQVRTTLARLSGGRLFDAEEVGVEEVEQGDADVGQLLADDDGSGAANATAGADAAEDGDGDEGAVDDVNITDIGAATAATGTAGGGALPDEDEEDEDGDVDEAAAAVRPSARARPTAARASKSPSKRRPSPSPAGGSGGGGAAAPAARAGGGSSSSGAQADVGEEEGEDGATAALPADVAYSWLQPPSAPTETLLDAVRRVAWLRTAGTRPAGGPPCRGVGQTSPQSYTVALGYPLSGRRSQGGDDGEGDADGEGGAPRLQLDPAGTRQTRCVPVGGTLVLRIRSRDKRGRPMCEGGDFYEAQLAHVPDAPGGRSRYKARPRTVDHGDGSYSLVLTVPADPALAGTYDVAVTLLFSRYGGLTLWGGWKGDRFYKRPRHWKVRFSASCPAPGGGGSGGGGGGKRTGSGGGGGGGGGRAAGRLLAANATTPAGARRAAAAAADSGGFVSCREIAFTDYPLWAGHWVNVGAAATGGGSCAPPYCTGSAARLGPEAEGWVYRLPRCYFHLFSTAEARTCLAGRWLAMFGDSNHQDTGRNVFHYVLDAPIVRKGGALPRTYDVVKGFDVAGRKRHASLRVTNLFTGHYETLGNNLGVRSLAHAGLRERHWPLATGNPRGAFAADADGEAAAVPPRSPLRPPPSALVFNSGLHDALFMPGRKWSPSRFVTFVRDAAGGLWGPLLEGAAAAANATGAPPPRVVWHTTVAPAGVVNRRLPLNPQKVEVMNRLTVGELLASMRARLAAVGMKWDFIDYYDLTFPWHWDNRYSDGGHYGRAPWHRNKGGKKVGAAHFVDVMYIHVLLNLLCPAATSTAGGSGSGEA